MSIARGFGVGLALTAVAPASLAAQDARLAARLPAGVARAVEGVVDSARAAGLPTEPLVLKALEGRSKGADSGMILFAVRGLARQLGAAGQALGPGAGEGDLVAAAAALRAGATPQSLTSLRSLRPDRPLAVPLSVLADLLTSGVAADQAWTRVRDMATQGASDAAFLELRDRMVGARAPPGGPRPPPAGHPPSPPLPQGPSP